MATVLATKSESEICGCARFQARHLVQPDTTIHLRAVGKVTYDYIPRQLRDKH